MSADSRRSWDPTHTEDIINVIACAQSSALYPIKIHVHV